jgi:hypothetical protein
MRRHLAALLVCSMAIRPSIAEENHLRYLSSDTRAVLTIHYPSLGEADRSETLELIHRLYRAHLAPELGKDTRLPLSEVRRIVFALPYAGSFNGVILVTGKVDRTQFEKQMQKVAKTSTALTVERMGKPAIPVYTRRLNDKELLNLIPPLTRVPPAFRKLVAPQEAHVAILDDQTLFTSLSGKKQVDRALRARGSAKWRVSSELGAILRKNDDRNVTSGVLMDDALHPGLALVADEETRDTFSQFEHMTMRITGGKATTITIEIQSKSSELAPTLAEKSKRALDKLRELLPALVEDREKRTILDALFKSFRISRKGERVTLVGKLTEADTRKLLAP